MFVIMQMALITAQSFNNFFPSIVGTLGYDSTTTLLLTAPPYFFAFFVSLRFPGRGIILRMRVARSWSSSFSGT